MTTASVGRRYQVVIPLKERQQLNIQPNSKVEIVLEGDRLVLYPISAGHFRGIGRKNIRRHRRNRLCPQAPRRVGPASMKPINVLAGHRGVVLDTMFFIYLFEDHPEYADLCENILSRIESGLFTAAVTPITGAELLVKPVQKGDFRIADRYRLAFSAIPNVTAIDITPETGFLAGSLRARYGLPLPDMFQAAAALQQPAKTLLTNDRRLEKNPGNRGNATG